MIYEFALEPALVARWHDSKESFIFREMFQQQSRRVVSFYPKRWRKLVWQEFEAGPQGQDQNAKGRLDTLLSRFCERAVKRTVPYSYSGEWLEQAEIEHDRRPFRAIIALENPRSHGAVIVLDRLLSGDDDRCRVPDIPTVSRQAEDLADAVSSFLCLCRELVLVDPHFDPSARRFRDPLSAFLHRLTQSVHELSRVKVELHTSIDRFFRSDDDRTEEEELRVYRDLRRRCETELPACVPAGMRLLIRIWKRKPGHEKPHNRYILGDVAGVIFGTGLDEEDTGEADRHGGQSEDITLLSEAQFATRRTQYCDDSTTFDLVGEAFEIEGRNEDAHSSEKVGDSERGESE